MKEKDQKLVQLINILEDLLNRAVELKIGYSYETQTIDRCKFILKALKIDLSKNSNVSVKVLRAIRILGVYSYREFENTVIESAILGLTGYFYDNYPEYSSLKPLNFEEFNDLIQSLNDV